MSFKAFSVTGFVHRSVADLLDGQRRTQLFVLAPSKKEAVAMLRKAGVQFLVLDVAPASQDWRTVSLVQRYDLENTQGVYATTLRGGSTSAVLKLSANYGAQPVQVKQPQTV